MPKAKAMMYTQQLDYLPHRDIEKLECVVKEKIAPVKYAMIVHNADEDGQGNREAEHVHLMMNFLNARSVNNIAKLLGDKPQYIEIWNGSTTNGYCYLVHATDGARAKHRYSPDEVIASFDYKALLAKATKQTAIAKTGVAVEEVLDSVYDGRITLEQAERELTGAQYGAIARQLESVNAKRLQIEAAAWREKMRQDGRAVEVVWIYGESATGKTSLARAIAQERGGDYFVTGSNRDAFQGYRGQHVVIMDEARPRSIAYNDLLRITDPFSLETGGVMAPSRFRDKALMCDLIIITAPYDPHRFYREEFKRTKSSEADPFEQLRRRITLTVEMRQDAIYASFFDGELTGYRAIPETRRANPYSREGRNENTGLETLEAYERFVGGADQSTLEGLGA